MQDDDWLEIGTGYCVLRVEIDHAREMNDFLTAVLTEWLAYFGQVVISVQDIRGVLEEDPESKDWIWYGPNREPVIWTGQPIIDLVRDGEA